MNDINKLSDCLEIGYEADRLAAYARMITNDLIEPLHGTDRDYYEHMLRRQFERLAVLLGYTAERVEP